MSHPDRRIKQEKRQLGIRSSEVEAVLALTHDEGFRGRTELVALVEEIVL